MSLSQTLNTHTNNAPSIAECQKWLEDLYRKEVDLIYLQRNLQAQRARLIKEIWADCTNAAAAAHETAGNDLRKITFASLEHNIDAACDAYNAAQCRALIPTFYAKLPRELRDMVYAYLTSGDIFVDKHIMLKRTKPQKRMPVGYLAQHPRTRGDLLCIQHFWRDEVVGPAVARELMESWYRCSTFHIRGRHGLHDETNYPLRFLEEDRFRAGLDPRQFVSRIVVRLALAGTAYGRPLQPRKAVDDIDYCYRKVRRGTLVRILLEVQGIIGFHHSELEEWLEELFASVVRLRGERYRVEVEMCLGGVRAGPLFPQEEFLFVFRRWKDRVEKTFA